MLVICPILSRGEAGETSHFCDCAMSSTLAAVLRHRLGRSWIIGRNVLRRAEKINCTLKGVSRTGHEETVGEDGALFYQKSCTPACIIAFGIFRS